MQSRSLKKGYVSLVEQACAGVPGFRDSYQQFQQKAVIEQNSSSFVENYGRNAAAMTYDRWSDIFYKLTLNPTLKLIPGMG